MISTSVDLSQFPAFARALKASETHLVKATGKMMYRIGRSDIEKMKREQLSGGRLHIRSKGFLNSFKFKATDSRKVKNLNDITLSEYTGAKPMGIFETGGAISPRRSKLLTVLTPLARTAGGKRKYTQKQLRAMIDSGQARFIKTGRGLAIVLEKQSFTKKGKMRVGSRAEILAYLRPGVIEQKRISFFENFAANSAAHETFLNAAADEALEATVKDSGK